jgi:CheY-like chemotaxis protein
VPTTLLAIDDSVTMRKVLEMTFAGEDFRVVSAESADAAFAKLRSERPSIVLCDVTLDGPGGYAVCAKIKSENPNVAVLVMASKQQPYDAHKGQSARADDFIEKPFDTQQLIDKVKRLATRPVEAAPAARQPMAGAPASIGPATQPGVAPAGFGAGRPPPAPAAPARGPGGPPANPQHRPAAPGVASSVGRGTLAYGAYAMQNPAAGAQPPQPPAQAPAAPANPFGVARPPHAPAAHSAPTAHAAPPAHAAPAPPPHAPAAAPHATAAHGTSPGMASPAAGSAPAIAAVAAASSVSNGQLAAKLQHLGLTDAQVSAVLSLSREVIEKVVWEVVPVLAETIIKEELKRLTSD